MVGDDEEPQCRREGPDPAPPFAPPEADGEADGGGHEARLDVVPGVAGHALRIEAAPEEGPAVPPLPFEEQRQEARAERGLADEVLRHLKAHARREAEQRPVGSGESRARPGARSPKSARGTSLSVSSITAAIATDGPAKRIGRPTSATRRRQSRATTNDQRRQGEETEDGSPAQRLRGRDDQPAEQHQGTREPHVDTTGNAVHRHAGDDHGGECDHLDEERNSGIVTQPPIASGRTPAPTTPPRSSPKLAGAKMHLHVATSLALAPTEGAPFRCI